MTEQEKSKQRIIEFANSLKEDYFDWYEDDGSRDGYFGNRIAAAIEKFSETKENKWISIDKNGIPEIDGAYLIFAISGTIDVGHKNTGSLKGWGVDQNNITHWQPLPEPPKTT